MGGSNPFPAVAFSFFLGSQMMKRREEQVESFFLTFANFNPNHSQSRRSLFAMRPNAGRLDASQTASDASRLQSRRSERAGEWLARGIGGGAYPMPPSSPSPSSSFLSPPSFHRRPSSSRLLLPWSKKLEQRHVIVALAFAATAIAYVERVGFAVVAAALSAERRKRIGEQAAAAAAAAGASAATTTTTEATTPPSHHDEASTGVLLSAFYWGYAASQVPGGWAAARFGPSAVLSASFAAWAAATLLTPLPGPDCGINPASPSCSLGPTAAARVLVGLAQGALIPALHTALAQRVPPASRPQATAAATSGMYLGAALASALLPSLIAARAEAVGPSSGPRAVLRLSAFLGLCWLAAWRCFGAVEGDFVDRMGTASGSDYGKLLPSSSAASADGGKPSSLSSSPEGRRRLPPTPWKRMLRCRAVWAIVACNFAFHYALYVVMNWMPAYFRDVLGTPLVERGTGGDASSSLAAAAAADASAAMGEKARPPPPPKQHAFSKASAQALPYALMFLAANAGGIAGDAIVSRRKGTGWLSELHRTTLASFSSSSSSSSATKSSSFSRLSSLDNNQHWDPDHPASRIALARKAVNSLGFLCAAAALLAMPRAAAAADPRSFGVAATCLVLAGAGFSRGGFAVNHMDIAPKYAGAVMALSNTAGTLAGVAAVSLTGALLERAGDNAVRGWRGATGVAAAVLAAAGAFFVSCASGEKLFGELDGY